MKRVCVIELAGLSCRMLQPSQGLWMESLALRPRPMRVTFPAVGPSVQASMTTGVEPGVHGVVSGGMFRRESKTLSFDERSNTLLNKKRFWHSRRLPERPKSAMLFCYNAMAGAAEIVLGITTYGPSSGLLTDQPRGLYRKVAATLGDFDSRKYNGPGASWEVSKWIAAAAGEIWQRQKPDLMWTYLPGLNFQAVRYGVDSPEVRQTLAQMDAVVFTLAQRILADGGEVMVVSNGGFVNVNRAGLPNVILRAAGLLNVIQTDAGEVIDIANSRAFAMVDHQIAHVYCVDPLAAKDAARVLNDDYCVDAIISRDALFDEGLGHERAGELILLAKPDTWFSYQWWTSSEGEPALAGRFDIPGRCGHDPCEMFGTGTPDAVDSDIKRVRASRGLITADVLDQSVIACSRQVAIPPTPMVTDVPMAVRKLMFE